jgi:hypothetical protein
VPSSKGWYPFVCELLLDGFLNGIFRFSSLESSNGQHHKCMFFVVQVFHSPLLLHIVGSSGSFRKFGNDGQSQLKLALDMPATASSFLLGGSAGVVGTARRSTRIGHDIPQLQQEHHGGTGSPHHVLQEKTRTIRHDEKPASDNLVASKGVSKIFVDLLV